MNTSCVLRVATLLLSLVAGSCSESEAVGGGNTTRSVEAGGTASDISIKVFKSPTCGCCNDWIDHIHDNGFAAEGVHPYDLDETKAFLGVETQYQSCHTGLTEDGFVFEGHVPARYIKQFLKQKPDNAIGLAVPGMPTGSPGMEMGKRFDAYQVLLLKKDGSAEVYADIGSPQLQY